ncbi:MAG: hypothetical protein QXT64_01485 [Desulfurococcaceae archaeon]
MGVILFDTAMGWRDVFRDAVSKATVANIVSAFTIIAATVYFIYRGDVESLKWLLAFTLGYLYGSTVKREGELRRG